MKDILFPLFGVIGIVAIAAMIHCGIGFADEVRRDLNSKGEK